MYNVYHILFIFNMFQSPLRPSSGQLTTILGIQTIGQNV